MKIGLLILLAAGCQSRTLTDPSPVPAADLGVPGFPVGTYSNCATGSRNPSGNNFLNTAGFQTSVAALTLTQSGTTISSTFVDQNGLTQSFAFAATTGTTASLAQMGVVIPGFGSLCVMGPGNETPYPATMTVNAGSLAYDAGMVFLTFTGSLQADAGGCGTLSQPDASYWILCEDRQGGAAPSTGAAAVWQLPAVQYTCNTQVETLQNINGLHYFVAGGRTGALTLTADGAHLTAQYSGDDDLAGTLRFGATSPTTAAAEAGQTLMSPCMATGGQTPEALPVAAGALTFSDGTLFVSFAGTMPANSSCAGAQVAGSLICSR
jgi:hypothetical protein